MGVSAALLLPLLLPLLPSPTRAQNETEPPSPTPGTTLSPITGPVTGLRPVPVAGLQSKPFKLGSNPGNLPLPPFTNQRRGVPSIDYRCRCGVPGPSSRLVGGVSVFYPWNAYITRENDTNVHGGALISDRYVVTDSFVVTGVPLDSLTVTLGARNRCLQDRTSVSMKVASVTSHPYTSVSVVRLPTSVAFTPYIGPVCLPPSERSAYWGRVAGVVSWGPSSEGGGEAGQSSCTARQLQLPVLRPQTCLTYEQPDAGQPGFSGFQAGFRSSLLGCVGSPGGPSLVCSRDGGGLVQYQPRGGGVQLIGLVPAFNNCNQTVGVTLFTRLAPLLGWLLDTTSDSFYCRAPEAL